MAVIRKKSGQFTNLFFIIIILILVTYYAIESGFFSEEKENNNTTTKVNLDSTVNAIKEKTDTSGNKRNIDTTAQIILLCGDSMADGLFNPLQDYANYNGHILTYSNWGSSTTPAWVSTGKMKYIISKYKPTYILLVLGSNELYTSSLKDLKKNVQKIYKQTEGIKFAWIGPPNWKEDNGFNDVLKETLGEGIYFVSKDLVIERGTDEIHPSVRGYYQWSRKIADWIEKKSDYPIKIVTPIENIQTKGK